MSFPLMPFAGPVYYGELTHTISASTANILAGDIIVLTQNAGGSTPPLQSGFSTLFTDTGGNDRSRVSWKVATAGDIGASWTDAVNVTIVRSELGSTLTGTLVGTGVDGAFDISSLDQPVGAVYAAMRFSTSLPGANATVNGGGDDGSWADTFSHSFDDVSHRTDVFEGPFLGASVTLANATSIDTSRWLIVSRA